MSLRDTVQSEKADQTIKSRDGQVFEPAKKAVAATTRRTADEFLAAAKAQGMTANTKLVIAGAGAFVALQVVAVMIYMARSKGGPATDTLIARPTVTAPVALASTNNPSVPKPPDLSKPLGSPNGKKD